jgi:hypothetical protein
MSGLNQRNLILGAYVLLFFALIGQAFYFVVGIYSVDAGSLLYFVPALCFGLVVVSVIVSIWLEQRTTKAKIRESASSLIKIVLVLVILGIFSAVQASSWWRIDSKAFAQLVNFAIVPAIGALLILVIARFLRARKPE